MRRHIGVYFQNCEQSEQRGGEIGTKVRKIMICIDLSSKNFVRNRSANKAKKVSSCNEESATYGRSFFANRLRTKMQKVYPFETIQVLNKVLEFSRCEQSPSSNVSRLCDLRIQEGLCSLCSLFSQFRISKPLLPLSLFAPPSPLHQSPVTRARICCCCYSFEREREREPAQSWKANKRRIITRSALCPSI